MDNYQPKYSNPAITLPFIADKHRNKGHKFYDFDNGQKLNIESGNEPLYNFWKNDAINMANARVQSTLSSQNRLLQPRHPRIQPYNRSGQPFFLNVDQADQNQKISGSGNTTYSARLSDADRDARRKRILERLGNNYEKFKSGDTTEDVKPMPVFTQQQSKDLEGKLLLDSLVERITTGDWTSTDLLIDLRRIQNYIIDNIYTWNDYNVFDGYLEKLSLLNDALTSSRAEDIAEELGSRRRNYVMAYLDSKMAEADEEDPDPRRDYKLANAKEYYEKLIDNYIEGESRGTSASIQFIKRLYDYVRANAKGIGQSEKVRKQLSKSLIGELKLQKINKFIQDDLLKNVDKYAKEEARLFKDLNIPIPPRLNDVSTVSSRSTYSTHSSSSSGDSGDSGDSSLSSGTTQNFSTDSLEIPPSDSLERLGSRTVSTLGTVEEEAPEVNEGLRQITRRDFDGLNREQIILLANQYFDYNPRPDTRIPIMKQYIYNRLNI